MFRFILKLSSAAVIDALRSMGTTALAVGAGLIAWVVSSGGIRAALENWDYALLWTIGVWLALLVFHASRHFQPLLREHRRVFRLLAFNQDQVSDPDRVSIWCLLEFCRDLGPVDLTVRVTTLFAGGPTTRVVHTERLERVLRGERKRLRLGSLRIAKPHRPAYHSIWGSEVGTEDLPQGQVPIMADSKHVIEIAAGPQTYRCYIEFVTPPVGALCAAMYMTDEDRSPWILKL
jgi:hypothetical protein